VVVEDRKPQQAHLKVYGCKAFTMTTDAMKKASRLQRLKPKVWIGYLVGYDSTNIYRIWNPQLNKVFRTREVTFNEDSVYNEERKATQVELDKLQSIISNIEELENEESLDTDLQTEYEDSHTFIRGFDDNDTGVYEVGDSNQTILTQWILTQRTLIKLNQFGYPTPASTPPAMQSIVQC
jgi:hypothetical protein